jgi:MatE
MEAQVRSPDVVMSQNGSAERADVGSRPEDAAPAATQPPFDPRTRVLLEGPMVSTLLRLATPNVLVMFVQASVGLIETYFIAKLGTDALAGVALVFPVLMLMQMMSAGAMGGGISSAIARALGAGRRRDANALVVHALVIAVGFGLLFMITMLAGGRWLYRAMGGRGASLTAALTYSDVVFAGAILIWVFNSLANVIRGTGNMAVPAVVTSVGAAALIPLSPCLIFGWGPSRVSASPAAPSPSSPITSSGASPWWLICARDAAPFVFLASASAFAGRSSATFCMWVRSLLRSPSRRMSRSRSPPASSAASDPPRSPGTGPALASSTC